MSQSKWIERSIINLKGKFNGICKQNTSRKKTKGKEISGA
ncbi:hypothetical protein LEP1GSC017_3692 [Leptospira meyeri serovar Hardjo str. Went 5]|nr:hypothetical protein LEP1GSC017_3692 [Leptospira meyeri serovar Hardjo str. Went 5]